MANERTRFTVKVPQQFRAIAEIERRSISNLAYKVLSEFVARRNRQEFRHAPRKTKP